MADRLFRTPSGELIEFRALYCREVPTQDFVRPDGALDDRIQAALRVARIGPKRWILTENPKGRRSSIGTGVWPGIHALEDRTQDPPLAITTGSLDMGLVASAITEPDLELPAEIRDDPFTPDICRTTAPGALPADEALRRFAAPLEPLRAVLRMFLASGLTRVAVIGQPPMSTDEAECDTSYRSAGFPQAPRASMMAWRYKTLLLINAALRDICSDVGVPYVDRWAAYSRDGLVRMDVLRDFAHFGEKGMLMTAAALVDVFAEKPAAIAVATLPAAKQASSAAMRDRYDARYYREECGGADNYALFGGRKLEEPRLAAVRALAAVTPGMRVLDLGCGRGELSYAFAASGAQVTALDYAPAAVELTRTTLGNPPARLECADAASFEDANGYDVAVAAMMVEHFGRDELARLYRNVAAMLRPAGSFVLHTSTEGQSLATHTQLLNEAFEHVWIWQAGEDDPRGALGRPFAPEDVRDATEVFAVASHQPLDAQHLLERITTAPVTAHDATVTLTRLSAPRAVRAGERFVAKVTLRNDTAAVLRSFSPNAVRFAYAWTGGDALAQPDVWAGAPGRSLIEPPLEPGAERRYALAVAAPPDAGRRVLHVTVVQEMVRWFDVEVQATVDVEVQAAVDAA
ncbi:MAG TPA: class I SAM-dependent methyltransferase [Candidatus Elarobacter sp.]